MLSIELDIPLCIGFLILVMQGVTNFSLKRE
jgi:hypothetical protein